MKTEDDYSDDELEKMNPDEYDELSNTERPELSELYAEYIRKPYRERLLTTLKSEYDTAEFFTLMANSLSGSNPYSILNTSIYDDYDEENVDENMEVETIEIVDITSYLESTIQKQAELLNNPHLIRAYEWLSTIY